MEKILNLNGLGVSGRQNELVELALTFNFNTVEVDMNDLIGRHDTMGKDFACQFLQSAKINIGSSSIPINLEASDEVFKTECEKIDTIISLCEALGAKRLRIPISTTSDEAFQANFERYQKRLAELGDKFGAKEIRLGLVLQPKGSSSFSNKFVETPEEIMTLVKTVGHKNVGLCLDTWQWQASGGAMDQISELDVANITEVAMCDIISTADVSDIKKGDRVLPGGEADSFSEKVLNHLKSSNYEGAVSISTAGSLFANMNRDKAVHRVSQTLDRLISGESIYEPIIDFRASLEAESGDKDKPAEGKAAEGEKPADDAAKADDSKGEAETKADAKAPAEGEKATAAAE